MKSVLIISVHVIREDTHVINFLGHIPGAFEAGPGIGTVAGPGIGTVAGPGIGTVAGPGIGTVAGPGTVIATNTDSQNYNCRY